MKLSNKHQHRHNQPKAEFFVIYLHPSKLNINCMAFKDCLI